ncbi:MAG: type I-E CRISPR-associated protein Cas5/CasD [Armatimonadetes bacterium]|nr:type I-E CRISPR-associated protein Cas5/CasD [Armatimonadota bacterium]
MSGQAVLLLRLQSPLQSWGYRSRFRDRDTGTEPTKSGVVGLLCCALGRDRSEPLDDLAGLKMDVCILSEGQPLAEFQTAGGGSFRGSEKYFAPTSSGATSKNPVVMTKHYLADAEFLVALTGPENLITELKTALHDPVWPLALGRKSCPPAMPLVIETQTDDAESAFCEYLGPRSAEATWCVFELEMGDFQGESRQDVPIAWPDTFHREYGIRYVSRRRLSGVSA